MSKPEHTRTRAEIVTAARAIVARKPAAGPGNRRPLGEIVHVCRLLAEAGGTVGGFAGAIGLHPNTLRRWAAGCNTDGEAWPELRAALGAAGLELRARTRKPHKPSGPELAAEVASTPAPLPPALVPQPLTADGLNTLSAQLSTLEALLCNVRRTTESLAEHMEEVAQLEADLRRKCAELSTSGDLSKTMSALAALGTALAEVNLPFLREVRQAREFEPLSAEQARRMMDCVCPGAPGRACEGRPC